MAESMENPQGDDIARDIYRLHKLYNFLNHDYPPNIYIPENIPVDNLNTAVAYYHLVNELGHSKKIENPSKEIFTFPDKIDKYQRADQPIYEFIEELKKGEYVSDRYIVYWYEDAKRKALGMDYTDDLLILHKYPISSTAKDYLENNHLYDLNGDTRSICIDDLVEFITNFDSLAGITMDEYLLLMEISGIDTPYPKNPTVQLTELDLKNANINLEIFYQLVEKVEAMDTAAFYSDILTQLTTSTLLQIEANDHEVSQNFIKQIHEALKNSRYFNLFLEHWNQIDK